MGLFKYKDKFSLIIPKGANTFRINKKSVPAALRDDCFNS